MTHSDCDTQANLRFPIGTLAIIGLLAGLLMGCGSSSGSSSNTTTPTDDNTPLTSTPQNVEPHPGESQITLSWSTVTGADNYNVYWSTSAGIDPDNYAVGGGNWQQNVAGSPYAVTELSNGTTYYLVVTAVSNGTEGEASAEVSATPAIAVQNRATGALNDTGIVQCTDADSATEHGDCPVAGFPGQDAEHGRDALALAGTLSKTGSGPAGFDFTKIGSNGTPLAIQDGTWNDNGSETEGTKWSCVLDNVTGLLWEVKVNDSSHLRHRNHTYSWYNPDGTTNGGDAGTPSGGSCSGTVAAGCDTEKFVAAVNALGLCGHTDWRLASRFEFRSVADYGRGLPRIDPDFVPDGNRTSWTSTPWGSSTRAWDFDGAFEKSDARRVRLVRAVQ